MLTTIPLSLRLFLGIFSGYIACFSVIIALRLFALRSASILGIITQSYVVVDLLVICICLGFQTLLLVWLYRKSRDSLAGVSKTGTVLRKTVTVLLWILFIFFFLFFLFYLYKGLGKGGSDISLASFIAGFLVGITLLPRFVFCHHYNPRRAMRGAIIAGAVAMLCYCLVLSVQYYIQSRDWNDDLPAIWTHRDIFNNYIMNQLRWYFLSPVNLFIIPLWGFMGWRAHRWFHKRDHHFWPVDLTVFE